MYSPGISQVEIINYKQALSTSPEESVEQVLPSMPKWTQEKENQHPSVISNGDSVPANTGNLIEVIPARFGYQYFLEFEDAFSKWVEFFSPGQK